MRLVLALIFAIIVATVLANKPEEVIKGIVELTKDNVDSVLNGEKYTLVEFYAPWCGHCKNLVPEMHKLGESFAKFKPTDTQVAKVNCVDNQEICSKYGVSGYPTLKFFKKGENTPSDYQGGRTAEDLANFIKDNGGARIRIASEPSFVKVLTPSNFDQIVGKDKFVFVKFYAPWCGHCKAMAPTFEEVGKTFLNDEDCVIAKLDADKHRDLAQRFDVKGFPTLKYFPKNNAKGLDYSSGRDGEALVKFMNEKCGLSRKLGGGLDETAGLVPSLNKLAKKFIEGGAESIDQVLQDATKAAADVKAATLKRSSQYYVKVMKKIKAKGKDWVNTEIARLNKLRDAGSIAASALDYLQVRLNVLSRFK